MIVTSDFECGNGKDITKLTDRWWRITEEGDCQTYCYYFCVELKPESEDEPGEVTLEIVGDPNLRDDEKGDVGTQGLMGHTPFTVWVSRWQEWRQLPQSRVQYLPDRVIIRLEVPSDRAVRVTNVIPASYTDTVGFLEELAGRMPEHAEFIKLGETAEGRFLPGVHVTEGLSAGEKPCFVIFSGQHAIEFPGVWGTRGIADFLTTEIAEAAELRKRWNFIVLPLVNPDGTFHGRNNFNAKGENVYGGFDGAADGTELTVAECRDFWRFFTDPAPDMMLNIHCYCSLGAFVERPMNGMYVLRDSAFTDDARRTQQRIIDDHVRFATSGLSGHTRPNQMGVAGVNHQFALAHGTFSTLFEINASTHGPWGCTQEALKCFRAMIAGYERVLAER